VFEHQIPGGQYSNLLVQCKAMGLQGAQWEQVPPNKNMFSSKTLHHTRIYEELINYALFLNEYTQ